MNTKIENGPASCTPRSWSSGLGGLVDPAQRDEGPAAGCTWRSWRSTDRRAARRARPARCAAASSVVGLVDRRQDGLQGDVRLSGSPTARAAATARSAVSTPSAVRPEWASARPSDARRRVCSGAVLVADAAPGPRGARSTAGPPGKPGEVPGRLEPQRRPGPRSRPRRARAACGRLGAGGARRGVVAAADLRRTELDEDLGPLHGRRRPGRATVSRWPIASS